MRGEQNLKESIIQNLKDAGCDKKIVDKFFELFPKKEKREAIELLEEHRKKLLEKLHKNEKELDNLDYLILDLKNNNYKNV